MSPEIALAVVIRGINAVLWVVVVLRILRHDRPTLRMVRQLVGIVVLVGMCLLAFGSLAAAGLVPGFWARDAYTIYTGFTAVIALAIAMGKSDDPMKGDRP